MMQTPLILPQIVALDVLFALVACLQTIHLPLIASRRSSYNRKVICAYEASLVLHLAISAVILFASSGSYLVAPLYVVAEAAGALLWLNAAIAAYGVVLMVHYRRPVMMVELLLVVGRDAAACLRHGFGVARGPYRGGRVLPVPLRRGAFDGRAQPPGGHHGVFDDRDH